MFQITKTVVGYILQVTHQKYIAMVIFGHEGERRHVSGCEGERLSVVVIGPEENGKRPE